MIPRRQAVPVKKVRLGVEPQGIARIVVRMSEKGGLVAVVVLCCENVRQFRKSDLDKAARLAVGLNVVIALCNLGDDLAEYFAKTRLLNCFEIFDTQEEAVRKLSAVLAH